jgi:hypothetical protein
MENFTSFPQCLHYACLAWWLTSVILATQGAEIRRITIFSKEKSWAWWCASVIPATVGSGKQEDGVQASPGIKGDPIPKQETWLK